MKTSKDTQKHVKNVEHQISEMGDTLLRQEKMLKLLINKDPSTTVE